MRKSNSTSFLHGQILIAVAAILAATEPAISTGVTLQDAKLLVTFDSDSGALTRLEDKSTGWVFERRSEFGVSFRLHAPERPEAQPTSGTLDIPARSAAVVMEE